MCRYFFISDLHLSAETPEIIQRFAGFTQSLEPTDRLYILGDLFDAWVGDDDDSDFALQVQQIIANAADHGVVISVMHGNRDFMIGDDFCRQNHVQLLDDPQQIEIAGTPYLLTHGDQLCSDDVQYLQARQMRMQPQWLEAARAKPLDERRQIAMAYRQMSGEAKSNLAADIMDVNQHAVVDWFRAHQVTQMIHGHTHRPDTHTYEVDGQLCTRHVLDQWHEDAGMALCIDQSGEVKRLVLGNL